MASMSLRNSLYELKDRPYLRTACHGRPTEGEAFATARRSLSAKDASHALVSKSFRLRIEPLIRHDLESPQSRLTHSAFAAHGCEASLYSIKRVPTPSQ